MAWLTEGLVRDGHDVTLFATADSKTSAELVPCAPHALRAEGGLLDSTPWTLAMIERVAERAGEFDLIHWHVDALHLPIARRLPAASITTMHGRLDLPGLPELYAAYPDAPLVSISDAQRGPLPNASWIATVPHGLPIDPRCGTYPGDGDYFVFLGRISPEKRVDRAIEIAAAVGAPLKIAAKVSDYDRAYFEATIRPMLDRPGVEMLGEVGEDEKAPLLGNARALLFPIDWPEPFGLVMIEAMAHGTPVIAFPHGSVPEVIEDGVTGFLVNDVRGAVRAAERVHELDRERIHWIARRRFSDIAMTAAYVRIYERVCRRPRSIAA